MKNISEMIQKEKVIELQAKIIDMIDKADYKMFLTLSSKHDLNKICMTTKKK